VPLKPKSDYIRDDTTILDNSFGERLLTHLV